MSFSKLLLSLLEYLKEDIWPWYICKEGEHVLLEYLGKPISIKKDTGLYLKWPIINTIKKVNIKKEIFLCMLIRIVKRKNRLFLTIYQSMQL